MLESLTNQYVIIARDVTTDSIDNSVSLIKIVDKVDIGLPPEAYKSINSDGGSNPLSLPLNMTIASCFATEDLAESSIDFDVRLSLVSPLGRELVNHSQPITMAKGTDKVRININLQGLAVDSSGKYRVQVTALNKGKELSSGSTTLIVNLLEQSS